MAARKATRPPPAAANAFVGRAAAPTDADLTEALGAARGLWDAVVADLAARHGATERAWHSYSPKAGWALRVLRKGRVIVYLAPRRGSFLAAFALGAKAMTAAGAEDLPPDVRKVLRDAPRYAEGSAVRIDVTGAAHVAAVSRIAAAKIAH